MDARPGKMRDGLLTGFLLFCIGFMFIGVLTTFESTPSAKAYTSQQDVMDEVFKTLHNFDKRLKRIERKSNINVPKNERTLFYINGQPA